MTAQTYAAPETADVEAIALYEELMRRADVFTDAIIAGHAAPPSPLTTE